MELLTLILITLVAVALLLSYVSFLITIKMMREIAALKEKIDRLMQGINALDAETTSLMIDIEETKESLKKESAGEGMLMRH